MKQRFIVFRRAGVYYCEDTVTRKQESLRTRDRAEALTLLHARNESFRQPVLNLQIARTYLAATDPAIITRTWQVLMDEIVKTKFGNTKERYVRAMQSKAFDLIRDVRILETRADDFLKVLHPGAVATNVYLRRIHNFALDLNWLPWPVLQKKQWPVIKFKEKRGITWEEHQAIVARELNPERRAFYQLAWHLGASQSDIAFLEAKNIDWENHVVSFRRKKTKMVALVRFGKEVEAILRSLPRSGQLFPYFRNMHAKHRAKHFKLACRRVGVSGVTLHSYRYAWAERAKTCGYPERFAQEALGHNSKAVHRAYAKKAQVTVPALEEYEKLRAEGKLLRLPA